MIDKKCRVCRRAGEKLFLKGEKCFTPKCVFNKKPYPPGKLDADRKHKSSVTEYGRQMREKQKTRNIYGIREKQFKNYVKKAMAQKRGNPAQFLYEFLEARLDNIVYRMGIAQSRSLSRQLVSHGHITVNSRRVSIPSYAVRAGDVIGIRAGSRERAIFANVGARIEKQPAPAWIQLSAETLSAKIAGAPKGEKSELPFNLSQVIEFYSR